MMFEGEISGRPPPTVPRVAGGHDVGLGEHLGYTVSYRTLGNLLPWFLMWRLSSMSPPTVPGVVGCHDAGKGEHLGDTVSYCTLGYMLPWYLMRIWYATSYCTLGYKLPMIFDGEIIWYTTSYCTWGRRLPWCRMGRLSGIPPPTVPGVAGCHDVGWGDYLLYHLLLYLGYQAAMM